MSPKILEIIGRTLVGLGPLELAIAGATGEPDFTGRQGLEAAYA
ncbi:MAG: hypothetical protein ABSC06_29825 [Rhodopila sp.]|jgi:hypothetical protein